MSRGAFVVPTFARVVDARDRGDLLTVESVPVLAVDRTGPLVRSGAVALIKEPCCPPIDGAIDLGCVVAIRMTEAQTFELRDVGA